MVEYPRSHVTFRQVAGDHVRRRVEIGRDKHVQDCATAGFQPCGDRMTGYRIELLLEAKSGSADVVRYVVESTCLGQEIFAKICDNAGNFLRQSEEALGEVEANWVVVDHGHALPLACQHRREVASATSEEQDTRGASLRNASIIFTYGNRLSPDAELWLWKISPSR